MASRAGSAAASPEGLGVALAQARPIPLEADFAAAPGEVLALVGPSGSGKSSVLRCIAGLARPTRGRVHIDGTAWLDTEAGIDIPPHRRAVGMVFQSYALFPHLSALANVAAALSHLAAATRRSRAAELLALVHLEGLEERRPAALSGGQQQRVAVARALARDPAVLLLDEPFSAVDKATRQRLYRELAAMRQRLAMPVVLVTHDLDEALMLADRLCLLHHGRTLQTGRPIEVINHPASVQAARLVGQQNLFAATVVEHRPDRGLTLLDWHDRVIEAAPAPAFAPGARVAWMIPPAKVVLHRRDRPSRGEAENPVPGTVIRHLVLGDSTLTTMAVCGADDLALTFTVPVHVAERNRLAVGAGVTVSLLAAAIHVMPADFRGLD